MFAEPQQQLENSLGRTATEVKRFRRILWILFAVAFEGARAAVLTAVAHICLSGPLPMIGWLMDDHLSGIPEAPGVDGEARWPMAVAVLVAIVLTILLPEHENVYVAYLLAGIELVLLLALIISDPGKIDKLTIELRWLGIALVSALVFTALATTIDLVYHLIEGGKVANNPETLLQTGGSVWLLNVIAFSFLYWELDGGGSAVRAHHAETSRDFIFPQHMDPELAPAGWRPCFVDYLYLGYTNATAFSPTDAMPITGRVKCAMVLQSAISLVVLGLVIARAVNVFS